MPGITELFSETGISWRRYAICLNPMASIRRAMQLLRRGPTTQHYSQELQQFRLKVNGV
jgi:hypothetical protein